MKRLSALGARESVLEYWHKIVVCSHLQCPICFFVHSYPISRCQTTFWNMSLEPSTKKWTASELWTKTICTRIRCPLLCPISSVGAWENAVFTLVPSEYRTRYGNAVKDTTNNILVYVKMSQLFKRWIMLSMWKISIQWTMQLVSLILLRWIVIYPVILLSIVWTTGPQIQVDLLWKRKKHKSSW